MNEFLKALKLNVVNPLEVQMMNPLKLAYVGDAVYEMYIRTYIITRYNGTPNEMSKRAVKYVRASSQANVAIKLQDVLSENEWTIIKRGRNQKTTTTAKNATVSDYRYATGFETLIGYLYLCEQNERLNEVIRKAIEIIEDSLETK